jgi:hypothetical protein
MLRTLTLDGWSIVAVRLTMPRRVPYLLLALLAGCASKKTVAPPAPDGGAVLPPALPAVYVAKVKNVLVGLPPTGAEVAAVQADPARLSALVDGWMALPQYRQKMQRFFQLAFQQTQLNANDFSDQVFAVIGRNDSTTPLILRNVEESFARTMVELTGQGGPLTEAMTTRRFMMTTALKELYGLLDTIEVGNEGEFSDRFRTKYRNVPIVIGAAQGPIPIEQTLDPTSPNFMHWYNPDVATEQMVPECKGDPVALAPTALGIHFLLLGSVEGRRLASGLYCQGFPGTAKGPQLRPSDFEDWTMVTIRPPAAGEETTTFYDLPALRRARELVLSLPRQGYFTTPAFFANWQTNTSNQMRVTINQTLIVATGQSLDGDGTFPPGAPGLDPVHSAQAACAACHKTLDPVRSIFSATYSWNYHHQQDERWTAQPGVFAFRGVIEPVKTIADFAAVLARHPLVAPGWVQKLCYHVNSAACDEGNPEFQRLVAQFRKSGHAWNPLVKALVTSPLVTHAANATAPEVVAVARRDQFCAALGARLELADPCGLAGRAAAESSIPRIASGLPSDGYGRGEPAPILPSEPTLFFAAGLENICKELADTVVDGPPGPGRRWSSAQPDAAIADFVGTLMALAGPDPRTGPAEAALRDHFAAALREPGTTATQALRSSFVVACLAPSAISVGL